MPAWSTAAEDGRAPKIRSTAVATTRLLLLAMTSFLVITFESIGHMSRSMEQEPRITRNEDGALASMRAVLVADQRSGSNALRTSVAKSSGSSHAAKWPPLSTSLK